MKKGVILVVDKRQEDIDYVSKDLKDEGYKVICLKSLEELEEKIAHYDPKAIVLALMFPPTLQWEGVNMYWKLRRKGLMKGRKVVFMSYLQNTNTIEKVRKTGKPFLKKPFYPQELVKILG